MWPIIYTRHYQHIVRDYCDSAEEDDMTEDQDQEVEAGAHTGRYSVQTLNITTVSHILFALSRLT